MGGQSARGVKSDTLPHLGVGDTFSAGKVYPTRLARTPAGQGPRASGPGQVPEAGTARPGLDPGHWVPGPGPRPVSPERLPESRETR